ncbi:MAG: 3-phosphoshikimate 1-carboxyvinyltransferase [Bacteroidia bacterium]|nr:3-phosphoshikimate 1-carboxyvinyltransferase [Bacteroidia bacterium]
MNIKLSKSLIYSNPPKIKITGSKSESNRLLLLQALYPELEIENLSNSDDSQLMLNALKSNESIIDIHHAGTAMRFLTAYFSIQENRDVTITGSSRMKERPIKILVDALVDLGANIDYVENNGFPPLKIQGQYLNGGNVSLKANVSSQYISALLLIAPKLEKGLKLKLKGKVTSTPYIKMTLNLLDQVGVKTKFDDNIISIKPHSNKLKTKKIIVESDWSSASYFYSIISLSEVGTELHLSSYKANSLQGDSILQKIYTKFGVDTKFRRESIILKKTKHITSNTNIDLDLVNAPDIAQTIAVSCLGLGIECKLNGLHTLKIKETDRLRALKTEIEKLGGTVMITENTLHLNKVKKINKNRAIATYNDHRMAMAFAPLALKTSLIIEDANVVSKSYPDFWKDLENIGVSINK